VVAAALFLSEFVGDRLDRWAHIDMSAPTRPSRTDDQMQVIER
jgi:leucyl aminopeptidase